MSISILNRGASGGLKPELTVIAPVSSVIDILQNNIIIATYTLNNNETNHTFILKMGTYTVKATKNGETVSKQAVIDMIGQYEIKLNFSIMLYNAGNEYTSITGGFVGKAITVSAAGFGGRVPSISKGSSSMSCAASGSGGVLVTKNLIDLTPYSKLIFSGSASGSYDSHSWHMVIAIRSSATYYTDGPFCYDLATTSYTDLELDISGVTESCYVGVGAYSGPSTSTVVISKLELR